MMISGFKRIGVPSLRIFAPLLGVPEPEGAGPEMIQAGCGDGVYFGESLARIERVRYNLA